MASNANASSPPTVLITGCSEGGIGAGLVQSFHDQGYHVFATARTPAKMAGLQSLPRVTLLQLDLLEHDTIHAAVEAVRKQTGGTLNVLVNNAARNHFMPFLDEDIAVCKKLYDTNVWGPLAVTQAFAPLLIAAKGTVAFVTSISGYVNVPFMGTYSGSKRAIEIMAETLRLELQPFQVGVLCIVTGAVETNGQTYFGDFALPEDSLYKPIESTIASRAQGNDGLPRMTRPEYADRVVAEIMKGTTGKIWHGNNAGATKFGTTWMPQSVLDSGVIKGTGLDELAQQVAKDSK